MNLFLNSNHALRSGWKFAAYAAIFLIILTATAMALSTIVGSLVLEELTVLLLNAVSLLVPAVAALVIMARFVDHKPIAVFGVAFHENWRKDLLFGLAVSGGMLLVLLTGCLAFGQLDIQWNAGSVSGAQLGITGLVLLVSAANEELVFRGYPLQVLMRGMGVWPAMLLMSVLFGLLHASNPNASLLGTANTVLAGLMLSVAYLKTRSLWLPYAIHIGWNLGLGFIMGFPLSGMDIASLWTSGASGSDLVIGGNYGPEGGLLATFIFMAAGVTVRTMRAVEISPKLRAVLASGTNNEGALTE